MLPAIQVIFFCVAIGRDPTNLPVGITLDEIEFTDLVLDPKQTSLEITKEGLSHEFFKMTCPVTDGCDFSNLSCKFLAHLAAEEPESPSVPRGV